MIYYSKEKSQLHYKTKDIAKSITFCGNLTTFPHFGNENITSVTSMELCSCVRLHKLLNVLSLSFFCCSIVRAAVM
jgi:fluoride ion exporter CrcB/FEX